MVGTFAIFLKEARRADQLAVSENLEAKREFQGKIGSNPPRAARTLHFDYSLP